MQTATKKNKSNKSRKVKTTKSKKSKPIKSTAKKASGDVTDTEKLLDQEDTAPDPNDATNSIGPNEFNKESDTVEGSNGEELKREQPSVEEILTEIIQTNKITGDAHAEQDSEDTANPNEAAARQSKVEESQIREADVSSDQENIAQDPDAANDSTDSKESNKESDTVEGSDKEEFKQDQPTVEETLAGTTDAEEIAEDAQTEQVQEDTADSENAAVEQRNVEESQLRESDVSSDQEDTAPDPNAVNDVAEDTAAAPETSEETAIGKIFEAIQKMTQSHADLPGQPATAEKSTPTNTGSLFKICAKEIMQDQVTWTSPDDSLQHAFAKMQQTDAGYIMVGQNGALEGIVSKSDITKAMSPYLLPIFAKWRRPLDDATLKIRIKWIMSRPVHTIKPETSLAAIMEHMSQFRGRCLPVMDEEGNVQGLVTAFDIFQALLKSNSNTCSKDEAPRELVKTASSTETP